MTFSMPFPGVSAGSLEGADDNVVAVQLASLFSTASETSLSAESIQQHICHAAVIQWHFNCPAELKLQAFHRISLLDLADIFLILLIH